MTRVIAKSPPLPRFRLRPSEPDRTLGDPGLTHVYSGRTAIRLAVDALYLHVGETVLLPAYHCGSEIDTLLAAQLDIAFYPLGPDLSADLSAIEAGLAAGAKAVYVIHFFGYPQPLAEIKAMALRHGAAVIEDVALGLYSTGPSGLPLGQGADAGIYSYVKTLPVPDGGGLWLPDGARPSLQAPALRNTLARMRSLSRNARRTSVRDRFADLSVTEQDSWDAGAGLAAHLPLKRASRATKAYLARLDHTAIQSHHRALYDQLHAAVSGCSAARPLLPARPDGACPAFFPLLANDPDETCRSLVEARIEPVRFWRRPHPHAPMERDPEVARLRRHVIRLPIHTGVDAADLARIIDACA